MGTKKGRSRDSRWYISVLGVLLVVTGLLAVAWASAHRATASAQGSVANGGPATGSAQALVGAGDKVSAQMQRQGQGTGAQSLSQIHLPISLPGVGGPPTGSGAGQTPSIPTGKGQPGGQPGGSGLESVLSTLGLWPALPAAGSGVAGGSETGAAPSAPAVATSPACSPNWVVVTTLNPAFQDSLLIGVTEVGPTDVWAGGYYKSDTSSPQNLPFFEHWDGTSWSAMSAPLPAGGVSGQIWDISANASNDIWAVGYYADATNTKVLIERWNGIQWSAVTGVNPGSTSNQLLSVAVVSTNNVWAVGSYTTGGLEQTLIEQWNGSAWGQVSSPNHGAGDNLLLDVSAVPGSSSSGIWAVGDYHVTQGGIEKTLTLFYNGTNWAYVASADQGAGDNQLSGVAAISPGDVWAVGDYHAGSVTHTLAEHWDGSAWTTSPTVDPSATGNALIRVFATASNDVWAAGLTTDATNLAALVEHWNGTAWSASPNTAPGAASYAFGIAGGSSGDIWAVGLYAATLSSSVTDVLTEHYNGTVWSQVYSADPPTSSNVLYSVSAVSATDVWAVGFAQTHTGSSTMVQTLIEHWDGSSWSIVPSPHPTTFGDQLLSVKAVSANDVWAVGNYSNGTYIQTFIAHWNGVAWSQISSPNPGGATRANGLFAVDTASSNDAWAVGSYDNGPANVTLILHWNGSAWLQFVSPNPGAYADYLTDVAAVPGSGGNDAWAVGTRKNASAGHDLTLLERWNGTTWSVVNSPNISGADNVLMRLSALSANDVWAVGVSSDNSTPVHNLALHWDGTAWTSSSIMQQGPFDNELFDVSGTASNDVYAVGVYVDAANQSQALIEHWNGSAWSVVPSVPTPGIGVLVTGVVAISPTDVWAVGLDVSAGFNDYGTLAEHYYPCVVSCSITFSDVPVGSTFYPYIHCLACLGIINGYPDGTFRPGANVTRGQLSKIVANSAGFSDPQPNQMFQDVPLGSTFQLFIGRLASRGYISGYACGGVGEPCVPPGNLPYFRPGANATRGQISKIDSNAAGYHDNPSGQQFQDVAVGSTYYTYTYRLVSRTIMGGYACGHAPAGLCVSPGNLPYFVPNNNATRGQTSKIVSGTFFPGCSSLDAVKP